MTRAMYRKKLQLWDYHGKFILEICLILSANIEKIIEQFHTRGLFKLTIERDALRQVISVEEGDLFRRDDSFYLYVGGRTLRLPTDKVLAVKEEVGGMVLWPTPSLSDPTSLSQPVSCRRFP